MMYLEGQIIKHRNSMDVCFQVQKSFCFDEKVRMIGLWINLGFKESYIIQKDTIAIMNEDLKNWLKCKDPSMKCLRDAKWKQIK